MTRIPCLAIFATTALAVVPTALAATGYGGYGTTTTAAAAGTAKGKPVGTLRGVVGPGFTISMAKKPTKAGLYKLVVTDRSGIHNFRLVGTKAVTSVSETGTKTFTVALAAGKKYTFLCDPHRTTMVGTFTVPRK
jgi:plastocyanin